MSDRENRDERRGSLAAGGITRRRFVQGALAGGVVAALDCWHWPAVADVAAAGPTELTGKAFNLAIDHLPVNFTGRPAVAVATNGTVPGPTLRWREGDTVTIAVTNRMKVPTSIHWHGVRAPADMDGVPGLSFPGIAPGETFVYRIPVRQSGTYWYHSHSRFQEQVGHYGALIIEPNRADTVAYDREYVVMLSEWTDEDPETIYANLKQQSDYYNYGQRTVGTLVTDIQQKGLGATLTDRLRWGRMNMSPTDIADVSGATYTYLINGQPPRANWTGLFRPRERVRLRFINGSSMTFFDVRIPGLPMTVVQADGNDVEPIEVDEFRIGVAETYDVVVTPPDLSAYTIFVQSEDRSGYARGTLAPRAGMSAAVPPMDPRPLRTMADMGMGEMAGMNMGGMKSGDMGSKEMGTPGAMGPMASHSMNDMSGIAMGGTDGSGMESGLKMSAGRWEEAMSNPLGVKPYPQPAPNQPPQPGAIAAAQQLRKPAPVRLSRGPQVDNVAADPTERLDDPGDGLNHNGRRVLTYAKLRARYPGTDPRPPSREIELRLSGNMERYIWGFNGEKFSAAEPLRMKLGERIRIVLINDTMMEHPIHLHGLWSELENGDDAFRPYKHTLIVKPGERLSYLVSADTPGHWAYHCHLLYHMEAGMFRRVIVS